MDTKILILEDDATFAGLLSEHLQDFDYKVVVVNRALEGEAILKQVGVDLVLADMNNDDAYGTNLGGIYFIRHVHKFYPSIPVILMTGAALSADEIKSTHTLPGLQVLKKPFKIEELQEALLNALNNKENSVSCTRTKETACPLTAALLVPFT